MEPVATSTTAVDSETETSASDAGLATSTDAPTSPTTGISEASSSSTGAATGTTGKATSESTGAAPCTCEGTPIEFEDAVDEGFSGPELLATGVVETPLLWSRIADTPTTSISIVAELAEGPVVDETGDCCGGWLCKPCRAGMTLPARLTVATEDGLVADVFEGELYGIPGERVYLSSDILPSDAGQGGWTTQTFLTDDGLPFTLQELSLLFEIAWDDDDVRVTGNAFGSSETESFSLGYVPPP